jgi:RNA polymerase sigma factor (sigma-70 family)
MKSWQRPVPNEAALLAPLLPLARNLARSFALRIGKRHDLDVFEADALLALVEAIRTYRSDKGCSLRTWAYRVVRRRLLDESRSRQPRGARRQRTEHFIPDTVHLSALAGEKESRVEPADDWDRLAVVDDRDELEPVLRALSPRERRFVEAYYLDGLLQAEIALREGVHHTLVSRVLKEVMRKWKGETT